LPLAESPEPGDDGSVHGNKSCTTAIAGCFCRACFANLRGELHGIGVDPIPVHIRKFLIDGIGYGALS
jgi:hypothetical protein